MVPSTILGGSAAEDVHVPTTFEAVDRSWMRHRDVRLPLYLHELAQTARAVGLPLLVTGVIAVSVWLARFRALPEVYVLLESCLVSAVVGAYLVSTLPEERSGGFLRVLATLPMPAWRFVLAKLAAAFAVTLAASAVLALPAVLLSPSALRPGLVAAPAAVALWSVALALLLGLGTPRGAGPALLWAGLQAGNAVSAWLVLSQFKVPEALFRVSHLFPSAFAAEEMVLQGMGWRVAPLLLLNLEAAAAFAALRWYAGRAWRMNDVLGWRYAAALGTIALVSLLFVLAVGVDAPWILDTTGGP